MRFHGLMLLRDEEDIIAENLTHLLTWIDGLYVYDLGSTDATWDIVQDFAARDKRVVPFRREPAVYSDVLRSVLFDRYRRHFEPGDWVVKTDADEFYEIAPPTFVRERLRPLETAVNLQWYFFRLREREVAEYESGAVDLDADRRRPIAERRRYYKLSEYSEPRMFRYRPTMRWSERASFPFNAGFMARERIPIRHYPHRDPRQMQRRYRLRAAIMRMGGATGDHWRLDDWRQEIVDVAGVSPALRRAGGGLAGETGIDTGPLHHWAPGERLPEVRLRNHLALPATRLLQRLVHPLLLPMLDRRRPQFDAGFRPRLIASQENTRLGRFVAGGSFDEAAGS